MFDDAEDDYFARSAPAPLAFLGAAEDRFVVFQVAVELVSQLLGFGSTDALVLQEHAQGRHQMIEGRAWRRPIDE